MWNVLLFLGLSLRSGRFNAQENEQLKSNVYDFLALTGIQSGSMLFHPQRFKEEEGNIKKLKRQHRFHERIGVSSCSQVHSIRELYLTQVLSTLHPCSSALSTVAKKVCYGISQKTDLTSS